ncbi:mycothiol synthase [Enemella sp. A6]|uniref:mycothiol synthase n=1 Tax=Enemella sp. A6 TaxID=3440152 RepID=UPI003EBD5F70
MTDQTFTTTPELTDLLNRAREADGVDPLNEEAYRALAAGPVTALSSHGPNGELTGYAHLLPGTAQLVVHPDHRNQGIGSALAEKLITGGYQLWSFGALPAARRVAEKLALRSTRELLIMGRDLTDLPPAPEPEGLTIRSFVPDDEPRIIEINAAAFAHHPEQGEMDAADFAERCAQSWFRPEGLLVAERDGEVIGFHWTKRRDETEGEVYVIGVDPSAHGGGVGKALLWAGLHHLADQGLHRVVLWVEGDQEAAVALYERSGFGVLNRDIVWSGPGR